MTTKVKSIPATREIADTRHAAFTQYEKAVLEGYTFDPANPPELLLSGFTIIRLIRAAQ